MSIHPLLSAKLEDYALMPLVKEKIRQYFEKNTAAQQYLEVCAEKNWPLIFDHLTVRTYDIDTAAKQYEALGWKYDETIEYKNEGWWAKVYRRGPGFPCMFIDQNYSEAPEKLQIIKRWVDVFGDQEFHHIAVRLAEGVEIEEAIKLLEAKGVLFPGKITGPKETRLRQIFSQAEVVKNSQFSVLELAQRNKDKQTGQVYEGFISEQADSLMKDSTL